MKQLSRLHTERTPAPVNACHSPSRENSHDSGASAVRYSFTARDFHSHHPAGLSRRFSTLVTRPRHRHALNRLSQMCL